MYNELQLDIVLEQIDSIIDTFDGDCAMEATSFAMRKHLDNLKQEFSSDHGSSKNFYRKCKELMKDNKPKEAAKLCTEYIEHLDNALYAMSQLTDKGRFKQFFEMFGAMMLTYILVGFVWLIKIARYTEDFNVAHHALQVYKEKIEALRSELRANGVSDRAEDLLKESQRIHLDDKTLRSSIKMQQN